jgi:hypothetical protein
LTTKPDSNGDNVDDYYEPEPTPPVMPAPRESWPGWSGRSSKIALSHWPVLRDHTWLAEGSPCVDCAKRGKEDRSHQFHARAARRPDGVWVGPEGSHVMALLADGHLRGTPQVAERDERQHQVDLIRGITPEPTCRNCRQTIPRRPDGALAAICTECQVANGLPELSAPTLEQLQAMWSRVLPAEKALELERGAVRDEVKLLREAVSGGLSEGMAPLAEILKELLEERK